MNNERGGIEPQDRLTVRVPIAMEMLGIGKTKIFELIASGEIETIRVGKSRLIVVQGLRDFIARQSASVPVAAPTPRRRRGRPRTSFAELLA